MTHRSPQYVAAGECPICSQTAVLGERMSDGAVVIEVMRKNGNIYVVWPQNLTRHPITGRLLWVRDQGDPRKRLSVKLVSAFKIVEPIEFVFIQE